MKIKLALLSNDQNYLGRIISAFMVRYSDSIEVYSFTNSELAVKTVIENKLDALLSAPDFEIDRNELPQRCSFAYLVDSSDVDSFNGIKAICRFQKVEQIYKQILDLVSENMAQGTKMRGNNRATNVVSFVSIAGGVGSSTAAAAFALYLANRRKNVLYLNLECNGSSDLYFNGEGRGTFSDVIYALKANKNNIALKIESIVKRDTSGVCFFSSPATSLDMTELSTDDIRKLIEVLVEYSDFDYIVADMDFDMSENTFKRLAICDSIVFVADGSEVSNQKTEKGLRAIEIIEGQREANDLNILNRSCLLYNRLSGTKSGGAAVGRINEIGGIKKYDGYSTTQLLRQISLSDVFEKII